MRRAVIVDDERLARRELRSLLEPHAAVAVVGEAETLQAAEEVIRATEADTVFLDIQLAGESGFDLLPRLEPGVEVVFVTAFDRYAVRAFELHALDYLLKPVSPGRLARTLERLGRGELSPEPAAPARLGYDDFLFLRVGRQMRFLRLCTVTAVTADADYTLLRVATGEEVRIRRSIGDWEARLPASHFVRIHRSSIVNLEFVERVEDWFQSGFLVYLRGFSEPLQMSRRYAAMLRDRNG